MRFLSVLSPLLLGLLVASPASAQAPLALGGSTYAVPFASEGHRIELALANTAAEPLGGVQVVAAEVPSWLHLEPRVLTLNAIAAETDVLAPFAFAVSEAAPVGETHTVRFAITARGEVVGEKAIRLRVEAPQAVALHAAYPNPFNPQTAIRFDLPAAAHVRLVVYNTLGQKVAVLVDEERSAGSHTARFDGSRLASGLYLYRLEAEGAGSRRTFKQGTMLLVK